MTRDPQRSTTSPVRSSESNADSHSYDVNDMSYLNDGEHVRARAGTYIGDLGTHGLHHLVHEVIDNSLDEAMAGFATQIKVVVHPDSSITIRDNGRGIPVGVDPRVGKSALECVMTMLKYGGKFEDSAYKASGGLNGMGMKAVNFLSRWCRVTVYREGAIHQQSYSVGKPDGPVAIIGKSDENGTEVSFLPDREKFGDQSFQCEILRRRLQTAAFLNQGTRIEFHDRRYDVKESFQFEQGLIQWVEYQQQDLQLVHPDVIAMAGEWRGIEVEMAFRYQLEPQEFVQCYANNIHNEEGGTHLSGFRAALTRTLMAVGKKEKLFDQLTPIAQDLREGLTAIIHVRLSQPVFDSQHKIKLTSPTAEKAVQTVVGNFLKQYWEEHPQIAKSILSKSIIAARARQQARDIRKNLLSKSKRPGGMPGKLRDCTSKDPHARELYLVEGDSAGGSAEGGRIREFQAILPLRGKIINAYKHTNAKVLSNLEVQSIIQALGIGVGLEANMEKLRYHKVIIMSDADVDGSHIRTLLLCLFYRQFPELITRGHVFVAEPPLFRIRSKRKNQYLKTDEELKSFLFDRGLSRCELVLSSGESISGEALRSFWLREGRLGPSRRRKSATENGSSGGSDRKTARA